MAEALPGLSHEEVVNRRLTGPPASAADRLAARLVEDLPVVARRVEVAGVSTALLEGGTGPSVVLVHGHGGFAESLADVISVLLDRYQVIAPDLPGLGRSELRGGQLGPAGTTQWLGQLIAATCTTPPILVGFSAGAGIAVRYALKGTAAAPQLVLVSPGWAGSFRLSLSVRTALIRFRRHPSRATAARVAGHVLFDADHAPARLGHRFTAIEDYLIERARQPGARDANRALTLPIGFEQLRQLTVPVVALICGRHDSLTPIGHTQRVGAELGWPLAVIEDAGHLPHLEQPKAFAAALRSALDLNHQPRHRKEQP
jgi:pimeloyl-ACP methyl ester carboxylesterase